MQSEESTTEMPNRFKKYKHTRRAYQYGRIKGIASGKMLNPAELRDWVESGSIPRDMAESIENEQWESVGHWQATESRDTGSHRGIQRLNRIEDIAENGVVASQFLENGDSCTFETHNSAIVSGVHWGL